MITTIFIFHFPFCREQCLTLVILDALCYNVQKAANCAKKTEHSVKSEYSVKTESSKKSERRGIKEKKV